MGKEETILSKIQQISEAESNGNYDAINQRLSKKRVSWYETNKHSLNLQGSDVHKAYEMILIEYMGLDPEEIPVVYEDRTKIVWRSYNWCPILEACKRLGLDTRKICKEGWEKSVQEMVEQINPKLRFSRNYDMLRPHGEYCEETIELVD